MGATDVADTLDQAIAISGVDGVPVGHRPRRSSDNGPVCASGRGCVTLGERSTMGFLSRSCFQIGSTLVISLLAIVGPACGWFDTDQGGDDPGPETDFFSNACVGVLTQEVTLQERSGPETWTDIAGTGQVGQEVLVGAPSNFWVGYLFVDGQIEARVGTDPFERGVHFDSDCAGNPAESDPLTSKVVLLDANFYENEDLSGEHCLVAAGSVLGGGYFAGNVLPGVREVVSQALEELCGTTTWYTADLVTDELIRQPYPGPD